MTAFDRSRFKATSSVALQDQKNDFAANSSSGRKRRRIPENLSLDTSGTYIFRVFPFHPDGGGSSFMEPVSQTWLERERDVWEDGKKTNKKEVKRLPVFNPVFHGDIDWAGVKEATGLWKMGPVSVYLMLLKKHLKESFESEEDFKKEWNTATFWKTGVRINSGWAMFGNMILQNGKKKFGQLPISNALKTKIEAVLAKYSGPESPTGEDLLSPVDEGIPLQIVVNKEAEDTSQVYVPDLASTQDPNNKLSFSLKPMPLTDDDLEELFKYDPLYRIYRNVYYTRDFDLELEGLSRFDESKGYGIMEMDEMISFLEQFKSFVPESPARYDDESGKDDSNQNNSTSQQSDEENSQQDNGENSDAIDEAIDNEEKEEKPKQNAQSSGGGSSAKERLAALKKATGK